MWKKSVLNFVFVLGNGQAFWLQLQHLVMSTCIPFTISSLKPSKSII
jgi:hypothetical protein